MKPFKYFNIIENSTSLFLVKILDLILTIWLIPYLIFKVGLENYGLYAFSLSIVLILINILNYGFDYTAVREISNGNKTIEIINKVFNETLSVKLFLFSVLLIISVVCIFIIPSLYNNKLLYGYTLFILLSHVFSLRWFFLSIEKMKFLFIIRANKTFIYVALIYFFINNKVDYVLIPLLEGLAMLIIFIITFFLVINEYKLSVKILPLKIIKKYLVENFNSFINLVIPTMFNNTVVFLTGVLGVPTQVSVVSIGVKLVSAFSTVNSILTKVFFPISNRTQKTNLSFVFLIGFGFFLSTLMYTSSEFIIELWLKNKSENYILDIIKISEILSLIPLLISIVSSFGVNGLLVLFKDKVFRIITKISFFVLIILTFILIPKHGVIGAAISLLLSRFIHALLSYIYYNKSIINEA
ncbi:MULTISPECIES: oligosaccharide flippase family protein [Tenacibaculum]|uniref:oligosaccharide flippase family protein n=1 Tax=Tenacibaculum TaxID=104267 RepID=UPI0021D47922|nr:MULTISPECIES: oligosaccharide flippase family protein [Tenacibaculum]MDO6600883.1 oligosaccharide flippase family protein [Tenacibaculum sp. 1_MG-2023]